MGGHTRRFTGADVGRVQIGPLSGVATSVEIWIPNDRTPAIDVQCVCTSPEGCRCDRPATEEDLLCDHCRRCCTRRARRGSGGNNPGGGT